MGWNGLRREIDCSETSLLSRTWQNPQYFEGRYYGPTKRFDIKNVAFDNIARSWHCLEDRYFDNGFVIFLTFG